MKGNMEERACALAAYIIENRATVRAAAKKFGVSKSTVHKDVAVRLRSISPALYGQVRAVLDYALAGISGRLINLAEKCLGHIRGGMATRKKYKGF